jgi:hypothetical protein
MTAPPMRPVEQQLDALTERLCREFALLGAAHVRVVVDGARAGYASATVLAYLPVLVERDARRLLAAG